ncbi:MAG: PD-(D/E)XK nuclease family protein [Bacteroidales bacterium]|nr:PD-(D/E)XK nuclease family protein [Bacteroidales bacterium]
MIPFLKQVAAHYLATDIEGTCFVFPNRRSAVFFRKYLGDLLREGGADRPMLAPQSLTINDFFYRVQGGEVTDRIRLLLELYESYKAVYPKAEPLDEFVFWGEVILADFGDVDKFLVDAEDLFTDVADFKDIQDDYSHLSEVQREAILHFVDHFRDRNGRLTVRLDTDDAGVKARFLQVWNILFPLYKDFRDRLRTQGMAYEGMVYRDLAERLKGGEAVADVLSAAIPNAQRFVFVGLNALNECEKTVLRRLRDAGLAEFCWDFVSDAVRDPRNKSSVFMRENVRDFPNAFPVDPEGLGMPSFHVVNVPSSVGQAKLAPEILARCDTRDPVETAFILPDENLLMPLLNSIPPEHAHINVTMGCPLTGGAVYSLVSAVAMMQQRLREKGGCWHFYHREVRSIFSNSLFRAVLTPEEETVVQAVKRNAKYYIPQSDLQGGPLLDLVFRPVITRPKEASAGQNHDLVRYLSDIVSYVGWKLRGVEEMLLELDFAKRCLQSLNLLGDIELDVLPATWLRLLDELLSGEAVPFRGEPLKGLQVMGPLETRALDFRNVILFSANEGTFPRRSASASFVPPELRKGFGLPTFEYQDSVWAYYFYRMIQRAEHVWLVSDSRTEGLKTGEESRYIKQLEYHYRVPLERFVATSRMELAPEADIIPKTQEDIDLIRNGEHSASSLQSYLSCPAKFYYSFIKRLSTEEEVLEAMDAGALGTVYHGTMQALYRPYLHKCLTVADLDGMLKDRKAVKALVRETIIREMQTVDVSGRDLVVEEVIVEYVLRTLRHDRDLLVRSGSKGFDILSLEGRMTGTFEGYRIKGFADRIDSYLGGEARIVDYKTGKVEQEDIDITDDNAADVVEKLFGPTNNGRPKIALQLFLYGQLVQEQESLRGRPVVNSIYSVSRLFTEPLEDRPANAEFARLTRERLKDLFAEMTDPSVPFSRTEERKTCEYCDFKMICGR